MTASPLMRDDFDAHIRTGLDLGGDHFVSFVYWTVEGDGIGLPGDREPPEGAVLIGVHEHHKSLDPEKVGEWCGGYLNFENVRPEAALYDAKFGTQSKHTLVTAEPLTVAPSLGCRRCPSHGYIREGRWVDA